MNTPFPTEMLCFYTGKDEEVIIGGRDKFPLVDKAFEGDSQIGVIGWGSQAPAQAQNLRDTLKEINSDVKVVVGLREGSTSVPKANAAGFNEKDGSLGEMYDVIKSSDMVILLISDSAQASNYQKIFAAMRPGATLGLSHGFLEGYLKKIGDDFPEHINVVMVAPKGMGPSVRKLYLQGAKTGGSGINSSMAVYRDVNGKAARLAAGWAVAIGSPVVFQTTIGNEWRSDIFGERSVLLGGLWGLVETLYKKFIKAGLPDFDAFLYSTEVLTSFISPEISKYGMAGFYNRYVKGRFEEEFSSGYFTAHGSFMKVMADIYENVSSGKELIEVIGRGQTLKENPMEPVDGSSMWSIGEKVRERKIQTIELNRHTAFTAGAFIGATMAQLEFLLGKGHCCSEVFNESLLEATDSLIPFMNFKGVGWMIDNCSITARLGARKWGPVFQTTLERQMFGNGFTHICNMFDPEDIIHKDIETCYRYKPEVAIVAA